MQYYEIMIRGHIDQRRAGWFAGLEITQLPEGITRLAGEVVDQAALHGILSRLRDMGIDLLSVKCNDS
ncbi:hypothetical protein [Desulfosporosinus sp. BICA1-9]|uniref:hypothetical protein n=1 Tax=Desulfosporosinus sp. BICA1-9 TaxID=1531958 RepID=UPI00054B541F|nr:hypothetical protein [Desulfosporosinus sp. BICA1-9]KJS48362.1 MAG: hypothetical protein VR66_14470 [Peptococcaceae bacterium BRH_c23]KJS86843.1 MAG: hypothetical protein JL57_15225 [Desulfosporosinus sp. BICA1-9]